MPEVVRSFHLASLSGTAPSWHLCSCSSRFSYSFFQAYHTINQDAAQETPTRAIVVLDAYFPAKAARSAWLASSTARLLASKGKPKKP